MIKLLRESVDGITKEGISWLKVLIRLSFLALLALIVYFTYPYAKSVVYHAKNRGDVEFRLLALEERCDHFRNEVFKLKRRIEKLE